MIIKFDDKEKNKYLYILIKRILKILYICEEGKYNYKENLKDLIIDIQSANSLFNEDLTEIIIKLNSIYINDFEYEKIRSVLLECRKKVSLLIIER